MCTIADRLLMNCGSMPVLEYGLIAAGVAIVIVLVLR